jgi:iron(III) transport system substrate-binding protein
MLRALGSCALARIPQLAMLTMLAAVLTGCRNDGPTPLVVYCSHDSIYSDKILNQFEQQSGIPVSIKFDTEATKSIGLTNLLISEKASPRCDVFWNNQAQSTVQLQEEGVLQPYQGPGYERIPPAFKDPAGHWTGFGARLRVFIVNTDKMPATAEAIEERLQSDDLSRVAMAKPLFGTTLTEYTVRWHAWGPEKLKEWHQDLRRRGLSELPGNGQTKDAVAEGVCDFGWTDTDDFFVAKDRGARVAMVPVRIDGGATISIPNTVALIRGSKSVDRARQLIDFLLSRETELALSASDARQVPLGPVDESALSDDVRELQSWAADGYDLNQLAAAHRECLEWLKSEYLE